MGSDSLESPQFCLAHELAHWFTPESPFDGLPPYVLEGLADFVALRIRGYPDARHKENLLIGTISVPTADLLATGKAWQALPTDRSLAASRIGSEVVVQLGLERLKQLAAAHAHPLDYVSEASKVSDEWSWKSQDAEGGQPEDRPPE
jgi:hypothetical protein